MLLIRFLFQLVNVKNSKMSLTYGPKSHIIFLKSCKGFLATYSANCYQAKWNDSQISKMYLKRHKLRFV